MSSEYEELKNKLDASIRKTEAQQRAIRAKREEKRAIKKAGGGHAIARSIMDAGNTSSGADGTDFAFGHNEPQQQQANDAFHDDGCMGPVHCTRCNKFHGYCREVAEEKERIKMLPTGNEQQSKTNNRKGGMDWLKNEDLGTTPKEAKILMVRYNKEGRFGARVEMKLAMDGKIKYWGFPPRVDDKNPNYRDLTSKFGHDENNWVDQRILLYLEQEGFTGQYFVRVDFPPDVRQSAKQNTASRGSARS